MDKLISTIMVIGGRGEFFEVADAAMQNVDLKFATKSLNAIQIGHLHPNISFDETINLN